jgi:exodeoxyribonuclease V alpha subunit
MMEGLTPFGAARRAIVPETAMESWLAAVAAAAGSGFDLGPEHVALAWETASWQPGLADDERQALVLLVLATLVTQSRGSTRLPLLDPAGREHVGRVLRGLGAEAFAERIAGLVAAGRFAAVIGKPGERKPLILDGTALYHEKLHRQEAGFASLLAARVAGAARPDFSPGAVAAALASVRAAGAVLSDEQALAVTMAASHPLTVISGGPGTGKTSIVVSILRTLVRLGIAPGAIALAAPTGKAAQRMGEAVRRALEENGPEPVTLHRLLGFSRDGSRVRHHEQNPLAHEVVIVDEASMIDMDLTVRLVRAVAPGARLVLLGDAQQLPSVGAGAVLRDLVPPGSGEGHPLRGCSIRLTRNYRMNPADPAGLAILTFARSLAIGDIVSREVGTLAFEKVEGLFEPGARRGFLERWYRERIASLEGFAALTGKAYRFSGGVFEDAADLERLFAHFESSRILCVTRVQRTGADAINEAIHALASRTSVFEHAPGEPVLMLANDHEKEIWNGDQGIVLRVEEAGRARLMAVFRRGAGFVPFHLHLLRGRLARCYAMTVHKAQGSEFDRVALVLPEKDVPLLTREIIYTAVTRARRSVVILGDRGLLETGAARGVERFSGVGERLGENRTPSPACGGG